MTWVRPAPGGARTCRGRRRTPPRPDAGGPRDAVGEPAEPGEEGGLADRLLVAGRAATTTPSTRCPCTTTCSTSTTSTGGTPSPPWPGRRRAGRSRPGRSAPVTVSSARGPARAGLRQDAGGGVERHGRHRAARPGRSPAGRGPRTRRRPAGRSRRGVAGEIAGGPPAGPRPERRGLGGRRVLAQNGSGSFGP
jgi:hypothetical protein